MITIKNIKAVSAAILITSGCTNLHAANADKTLYPVVFAHGMGGYDNVMGYDYWGNDYGTFVLDTCDGFLEFSCNSHVDKNQQSFVSAVTPFQDSVYRGMELADNIESYMATSGAEYVNIISHSQGGVDSRKAAHELELRKGYAVVKSHISIQSPHRGTPVLKYAYENYGSSLVDFFASYYGNAIYDGNNDTTAVAKQFIYDDIDPNDGITTGNKYFNELYPSDSSAIEHSASILATQSAMKLNPGFWLFWQTNWNIDADGYCIDDCDNDGAAGQGDGDIADRDDDGIVGLNSMQQGYRLEYKQRFFGFNQISQRDDLGYVSDINHPNEIQMTSMEGVFDQDHLDVIGVGPDTFDEMEFYAAITHYIAGLGY